MSCVPQFQVRDWPLWWFAGLESALERGDYAAAARAQRQLKRLGVDVQHRRLCKRPVRPKPREGRTDV
jgi:hypothetical protein